MNKLKIISLTASMVLAITFTVSCSPGESGNDPSSSSGGEVGNSFSYCLINGLCLDGPFTSKECGDLGGLPSNSCNGGGSSSSSLNSSSNSSSVEDDGGPTTWTAMADSPFGTSPSTAWLLATTPGSPWVSKGRFRMRTGKETVADTVFKGEIK